MRRVPLFSPPPPFSTTVGTRARSQTGSSSIGSRTAKQRFRSLTPVPELAAALPAFHSPTPALVPKRVERQRQRHDRVHRGPCARAAVASPLALRPRPPLAALTRLPALRLEAPRHTNPSPTPLRPVPLSPPLRPSDAAVDTVARAPPTPPCSACPSIASHPNHARARLLATNHSRTPRLAFRDPACLLSLPEHTHRPNCEAYAIFFFSYNCQTPWRKTALRFPLRSPSATHTSAPTTNFLPHQTSAMKSSLLHSHRRRRDRHTK